MLPWCAPLPRYWPALSYLSCLESPKWTIFYMRLKVVIVAIAAFLIGIWITKRASQAAPSAQDSAAGTTNLTERLKKLELATPNVGNLMLEIQLHFAKLYYAAEGKNWDLATFERNEIEDAMEKVAVLRPAENGVKIDEVIGTLKKTSLTTLKDAIDVKDRGLFRDAYRDTMTTCNACHQATGRPFIAIIVPTNSPVANQRWTAQ